MAGNFSEIESQGNISLKFGFLGLGMGGCAIAAECANKETQIKITNTHIVRFLLIQIVKILIKLRLKIQETFVKYS